ncbi:protein Skeletor, isoforms B/C isoform X2 [Cylas formicarius]|uniref:protein Skeletor, isoforms B/C isoform X2 n=1 Tax=Cylas formicarius TaxID=197179 RepID=UPI0029589563|nr:protein Skeletor, isoforms B/C isoform X2 [Cylas formicarius]
MIICLFAFLLINTGVCQDDEGPYKGKFLGKLNSYHHQVSGEVYAVDKYTLLLTSFNYDGNGADTFFWAGASNRPGPQGFIVPDEHGRTNVLDRYFNKDFTLLLPEKKKITDLKWFAIYDIWSQNTFGDIYIPEEFEPPTVQKLTQLAGKSNAITTIGVEILDAKRIKLIGFTYDGKAKRAYFWVGVGAQPVSKGFKVPDEYGYLDPLKAYKNKTLILELPGDLTIFNVDWFSIFDHETNQNLGSIIIPEALNVPPSLIKVIPHKGDLPNCLQLHKNYQVAWEIFGPQITIQLAGMVDEDEYLSFGISGSSEQSQMLGADIAVAYIHGYQGFATDYNITALTPCVKVLGQYKGVCKDEMVGGQDSNQINTAVRENGINTITYRRHLISRHTSTALAWYINGLLAPEIWLRRGLTYVFKVYGGNNPHSAEYYHPMIITDDPHGGYDKLTDEAQSKIRVLAGVEYSRRGRPRPTAAGPLCLSKHAEGRDRRLDDDFESFKKFNRTLVFHCESGDPGILEFTPNTTWPDVVYYNSFTQANMGWKIRVIDSFNQRSTATIPRISTLYFFVLFFVDQLR